MQKAMEGTEEVVQKEGELWMDVEFPDDQGVAANAEKGLHRIMERLHATAAEYGMKINKMINQGNVNV
jgi:hypothetical protein